MNATRTGFLVMALLLIIGFAAGWMASVSHRRTGVLAGMETFADVRESNCRS